MNSTEALSPEISPSPIATSDDPTPTEFALEPAAVAVVDLLQDFPNDAELLPRLLAFQPSPPLTPEAIRDLVQRVHHFEPRFFRDQFCEIANQQQLPIDDLIARFNKRIQNSSSNASLPTETFSAEPAASHRQASADPAAIQRQTIPAPVADHSRADADPAPGQKPQNPGHHSPLDELSPEQIQLLETTLQSNSQRDASQILSGPPPAGLGFPVSRGAIQRYLGRQRRAELQADADEARATAEELLRAGDDTQITHATKHLLRVRLLNFAMQPNSSIDDLVHLALKADQLRLTELRERRLALAENK